ncbi:hypothetical protein CDAR_536211 [Caerostris darwini]|uniref:Uncharacterized protein n=1 Tax=Caerostris darwini TaxID=1538125 RepID=A0AAV4V6Z4_9ARAC|nr:hypothetical protein CDAR_536211 [Caerostris darwini]
MNVFFLYSNDVLRRTYRKPTEACHSQCVEGQVQIGSESPMFSGVFRIMDWARSLTCLFYFGGSCVVLSVNIWTINMLLSPPFFKKTTTNFIGLYAYVTGFKSTPTFLASLETH